VNGRKVGKLEQYDEHSRQRRLIKSCKENGIFTNPRRENFHINTAITMKSMLRTTHNIKSLFAVNIKYRIPPDGILRHFRESHKGIPNKRMMTSASSKHFPAFPTCKFLNFFHGCTVGGLMGTDSLIFVDHHCCFCACSFKINSTCAVIIGTFSPPPIKIRGEFSSR
jgi:hypothetical protein